MLNFEVNSGIFDFVFVNNVEVWYDKVNVKI